MEGHAGAARLSPPNAVHLILLSHSAFRVNLDASAVWTRHVAPRVTHSHGTVDTDRTYSHILGIGAHRSSAHTAGSTPRGHPVNIEIGAKCGK
jgi:hypothetical protein